MNGFVCICTVSSGYLNVFHRKYIATNLKNCANFTMQNPAIDRQEGFRPGGRSLCRRVLVPVQVKGSFAVAWNYAVEMKPTDWPKLASDCWAG